MAVDEPFQIGRKGLKLDAPEPGDIVTVKVKRKPVRSDVPSFGILYLLESQPDEANNPQHYRMTAIWRVIAVNGGQAVVEKLTSYDVGKREVFPISLHEWFEASDLLEAMKPAEQSHDH